MTISGSPRFDQLVVSEIEVDFTSATTGINVTAAFVDSKTGETHGWTKGYGGIWSEDTRMKLLALREAMENDMGKLHFSDAAQVQQDGSNPVDPGGLGEHLTEEDATSV